MAVSSTTTTICISGNNIVPVYQSPKLGFLSTNCFHVKPRRLCIRSSSDVSAETTDTEVESIEVPKEPPSLISALNVERALRGLPITDADHYGRLGIPRGYPSNKVAVAYNNKVRELESQGLEEEELKKQLELLRESYTIMSSVEERRLYDWSLARTENTGRYNWPYEADITPLTTEESPPEDPEDVGPTRVVGFVFLGWIVISVVLSISLNL
uniref:J domain-containing protein n=1 Tax=Lotus japonicus TaxID=34305 RepID=I3SAR4_LOTJA|nr:unknown [Lotus japonicus]